MQLPTIETLVRDTAELVQSRILQSNRLNEANSTLSTGGAVASVAATWGPLVEKIELFCKIVSVFSEVGPLRLQLYSFFILLLNGTDTSICKGCIQPHRWRKQGLSYSETN